MEPFRNRTIMISDRAEQIDILKAICSFLIVCIHVPFQCELGEYFTVLTRIAVPIFFMITGYFYSDIVARDKEKLQIKKIISLLIKANLLYLFWNIFLIALNENFAYIYIYIYMQSIISVKNLLKFLLLNESQLAGHLWYLGAIAYVLIIAYVLDKLGKRKLLLYLTPILLVMDLILGKYALVILHHELPYVLVRNFLFVGIPYFSIGDFIRNNQYSWVLSKKVLLALIGVFAITGILERYILVSVGLNATRDHYISTTLLAVCIFIYALKCNWNSSLATIIGREYSTWIYIIHPIFISCLGAIISKLGIESIYDYIAPMVVYSVTLIFVIAMHKLVGERRREG